MCGGPDLIICLMGTQVTSLLVVDSIEKFFRVDGDVSDRIFASRCNTRVPAARRRWRRNVRAVRHSRTLPRCTGVHTGWVSRSTQMRKLARLLENDTGSGVEAFYDQRRDTTHSGWYLTWHDGPTEATMRSRACAHADGLVDIDVATVVFRREYSDTAVVAAFIAHIRSNPSDADQGWRAMSIVSDTELPGQVDDVSWMMARFAVQQSNDDSWDAVASAVDYVTRVGINGLQLDMWATSCMQQPDELAHPPRLDPGGLSTETQADIKQVVTRIHSDLIGATIHRDNLLVQVVAAEAVRDILTQAVDTHQGDVAAVSLVDGIDMSQLSTMLGTSAQVLEQRWIQLPAQVAELTWLRDHAHEWATACQAAGEELEQMLLQVDTVIRPDVWRLRQCRTDDSWRSLIMTPAAARRVVQTLRRTGKCGDSAAVDRLEKLLHRCDKAAPPAAGT